jgi:hypothetical protein
MSNTIYMLPSSRYWSGVYPESFATNAADIEKIVRRGCERFNDSVKSITVDMDALVVTMRETSGWHRTFYIFTVERVQ